MENDILNKLWETQNKDLDIDHPNDIIKKAKKQRNGQYISIMVMSITVLILIVYAFYFAFNQWNTFNLGLMLMISSVLFRIILEFYSLYRKASQLISMDYKSYQNYLKKYYKIRLLINYAITPICIGLYTVGFYLLLPYFKEYFSKTFYDYILISGIVSIFVVIIIIAYSILKENSFLNSLKKIKPKKS